MGVSLEWRIKSMAGEIGFSDVGITDLRPSEHASYYRAWLTAGRHGEMRYLERDDAVRRRLRPDRGLSELRSAVVVAEDYGASAGASAQRQATAGERANARAASGSSRGIVARYARGRDYHRVMKQKLLRLLRGIEREVGRELPAARAYVDTGPILERELARRAGLGWFGRNTMLIHPRRGSYFFLGSLLLELELEPDPPFEREHCGTCKACVEACPTDALLGRDESGAPVIDATRCISYLTIEQRGPVPVELRRSIGNRVFGCDICQEVCPWNSPKLVQATREPDYLPREPRLPGSDPGTHPHTHTHTGPSMASPSLVELMRMTRDEWDGWTRGSAIRRAGYAGLRRNVAVAIGNWLAASDAPHPEAVGELVAALSDEDAAVAEAAAWALARVGKRH